MTRIPVLGILMMVLTTCLMLATLAGCTLVFGDAHIRGTIYGDPLLDKLSAPTIPIPLAATVRCNGVSVTASATGKYDLKLPASEQYHCIASAPPNYLPQSVSLRGDAGVSLTLDFGPVNLPFSCVETRAHMQCAIFHLKTGNITGKVTYHGGSIPASGAMVRCTSASKLTAADPLGLAPTLWPQAKVTTQGSFAIEAAAPGLYDCFASAPGGDIQHTRTLLAPGGTVSLSFSVCSSKCNPVHYHGGPVMHTYTAYLIFWLPQPYTFEPSGNDARFESSIAQYFKDIGGTPFYSLLTQYWDYHGAVENSAQLGDVYVDTTPYEHCDYAQTQCSRIAATQQQPLLDEDVRQEIERAVHVHPSWHTDLNSEFFVFTGYNVEECQSNVTNAACTFTTDPKRGYCGYHDAFSNSSPGTTSTTPLIYSYIPDAANHCLWNNRYTGPHSDNLIDSELSIVSHEQFESVTDPLPLRTNTIGWYDDARDREGEIGDKCVGDYGTIQPDGSDVTLAHGHTYILQAEWSNRANRCAFG